MQSFTNPAVLWFIVGFVIFLLEFAIPGFILFFFAIGAWVVALALLVFDLSLNTQLLLFLGSSILSILLFRKWVKKIIWSRKQSTELEDEFLGKFGIAETPIAPGLDGKVDFKGTSWNARSEDVIQKGEWVTIVGNESILLIVKLKKADL